MTKKQKLWIVSGMMFYIMLISVVTFIVALIILAVQFPGKTIIVSMIVAVISTVIGTTCNSIHERMDS